MNDRTEWTSRVLRGLGRMVPTASRIAVRVATGVLVLALGYELWFAAMMHLIAGGGVNSPRIFDR